MSLVEKVHAWLAAHPLGGGILVGCSGGADSTALLLALAEAGCRPLDAAYVDHGLRAGTDGEAAQVAAIARAAGAGFARLAVTVPRRGNLLGRAREARYRALAERARAVGAVAVAVGHTATDQAETLVFRAARGDLAHALAGMPARRPLDGGVDLIRPLLDVTREEAAGFVAARGIAAVADPTNERDDLVRVHIRRRLAPLDGAVAALGRLADETSAWIAGLDARAAALGPLDALPAAAVAAAGPDVALRLLRRAGLHRAGRAHARALLALAASSTGTRAVDLGAGLVAERRYDLIRVGPAAADPGDVAVEVAPRGSHRLLGWRVTFGDGGDPLALDRLAPPLVLRNLRPGDRVQTAVGRKKLQDLLVDRKVPRPERRRLPILESAGAIAWIATVGAATPYRAAPGVRSIAVAVDSPSTCEIIDENSNETLRHPTRARRG